MGIQGLSAHKSGGWRAQWNRVLRWQSRVRLISTNPNATPADRLDFFLAFCQNCYALRDWLLKDGGTDRDSLDGVMGSTRALQVCRDICNGAKHFVINQLVSMLRSPLVGNTHPLASALTRLARSVGL